MAQDESASDPDGKVRSVYSVPSLYFRDEVSAAVNAERERCAKLVNAILGGFWHQQEDLDNGDGSVSDHQAENYENVFDKRCSFCIALKLQEKIRSGE